MKTPKLYNELVNEKKMTNEIIAECIYSVNKRAKNYRDKIKEYKNGRFHQQLESNIEKAEEEMVSTKGRIFESIYPDSDSQTIHWRREKKSV